jgi:hypothetical protein
MGRLWSDFHDVDEFGPRNGVEYQWNTLLELHENLFLLSNSVIRNF